MGLAKMTSRDKAIEIARRACLERNLPFEKPFAVTHGLLTLTVWTKSDHIGGNVVVTVGRFDGEVRRVWLNSG
jgi:hypothetical protein